MKWFAIFCLVGAWIANAVYVYRYKPAPLPHRELWELDPQGQRQNVGRQDCKAPRVPYFIDLPDGSQVYLECLRGSNAE